MSLPRNERRVVCWHRCDRVRAEVVRHELAQVLVEKKEIQESLAYAQFEMTTSLPLACRRHAA